MDLLKGDAAAIVAAALVQAECSLRPAGPAGPAAAIAARYGSRGAVEAMYRHYLAFVSTEQTPSGGGEAD